MISDFFVFINPKENDDARHVSAISLAKKYQFNLLNNLDELDENSGAFEYTNQGLLLHGFLDDKLSSLRFNLSDGQFNYRAKQANKNNELIARAIGCKAGFRPKVLDATAGMGRDSLVMASLGCEVMMQERCLANFLLLENALERLHKLQPEMQTKIRLNLVDSIQEFSVIDGLDVIYLDPMFPERKKSALVKKEMRLFKKIAGADEDASQLLERARSSGIKRTVVKRPKSAPFLSHESPTHQVTSKSFRFDVYLNF